MKKIITLLYLSAASLFIVNFSDAQVNQWVWLHGNNTPNSPPNFGTKGVQSASNNPPSVYEPCQWTDTAGNLWIFGGIDGSGLNYYGDLWRYNPTVNQWTWMKGSGTTNDGGNYGIKGIPADSVNPPSIGYGVPTWTDLNNNLWMYGGGGIGSGNLSDDLWKYNIATNQWTWMKGHNSSTYVFGVYGTMGMPDTANHPGFKQETAAAWTDSAGNLWIFGGFGAGSTQLGSINDLWKFDIGTNSWTWMKGSQQVFQWGKYGSQGVETATNIPGSRQVYSHWKDKKGNFWIFGGFDGTGTTFNDMWRYNPSTNNWTWMSGTNILYEQGVSGSQCNLDSSTVPYSRYENRSCWTDTAGDFWLWGGGTDSSRVFGAAFNDLWKYCVKSNQWSWVTGDSTKNPAGNWGTKGVSSPTNKPSGRGGAVGWADKKNNFYIYGGTEAPFLRMFNDLWKYTVDPTCASCAGVLAPIAAFQSSDTVFCQYNCVNYTDLSNGATSWSWSFPGGTPSSSTDQNPQQICYQTAGNYDVILAASNTAGADTIKESNLIKVIASPPTPSITKSNDTLYCSTDPSYTSYQWYDSTALIQGAINNFLVVMVGGNYNVKVTNENGCSSSVGILLGLEPLSYSGLQFSIQPNPASDEIILNGNRRIGNSIITIYNVLGEKISEQQIKLNDHTALNVKNLSAGIYFVKLTSEKESWIGRFVKE